MVRERENRTCFACTKEEEFMISKSASSDGQCSQDTCQCHRCCPLCTKKNPNQAIPSDLFLQARILSVPHPFSKRSPFIIMMFVSNQINRPKLSQSFKTFKNLQNTISTHTNSRYRTIAEEGEEVCMHLDVIIEHKVCFTVFSKKSECILVCKILKL